MKDILLDQGLDIKDLTVEVVKKSDSGIQEQYQKLKGNPVFYRTYYMDRITGHVQNYWVDNPSLNEVYYRADEQLAACLVVGTFDRQQAVEDYLTLEEDLSNAIRGGGVIKGGGPYTIWPPFVDQSPTSGDFLSPQLYSLLCHPVEFEIKERFDYLIRLFRPEDGLWITDTVRMSAHENHNWELNVQLLAVWAQHRFDPKGAAEFYSYLKSTPFYNSAEKRWYHAVDLTQKEVTHPKVTSEDALLGVIVESLFDKTEARIQYQALKSSPLYSKDYWNLYLDDSKGGAAVTQPKRTISQLIGLIAEGLLMANYSSVDNSQLPQVRSYR